MLYCPDCKQTYEEGTQRFCTNDGLRLLPAPTDESKPANQTRGVFTNVFNRAASDDAEAPERFTAPPVFRPPTNSRIFKPEREIERETKQAPPPQTVKIFKSEPAFELDLGDEPTTENRTPVQKSAPSTAEQAQTSASRNRQINPAEDLPFAPEISDFLVNQIVKERFRIVEKIKENKAFAAYLAEDGDNEDKRVLVEILTEKPANDSFAEELNALARVRHPNVASVIDSGATPDGKTFIAAEYVDGKSVKDMLAQSGQFNAMRAARIVQQASHALSEMHENDHAHRNLSAESIVLIVSDNGSEQVKLVGFGIPPENSASENIEYKAPEQIDGKAANFAADLYSLAVITYQMLTNRLPFKAASASNLLLAQQQGLTLQPTDLRLDVMPTVDEILKKALSFSPSARYPKARYFGDAFFNAVTAAEHRRADADESAERAEAVAESETIKTDAVVPAIADLESETTAEIENSAAVAAVASSTKAAGKTVVDRKSADDLTSVRRAAAAPKNPSINWLPVILLGAFVAAALGVLYYAANRSGKPQTAQTTPAQNVAAPRETAPETSAPPKTAPTQQAANVESSPAAPNAVAAPPDYVHFENTKQNLNGAAAKNFLGFSLYFPKEWRRNEAKNNFLDVSKNAATGTPVEQMLVSSYNGSGSFEADKAMFAKVVGKKTESQLKPFVPNYRTVSEGETTIGGSRRAYEVKFEGAGKTNKGEDIKLYGRRLYIPAESGGTKRGYLLTMLATSLSPDVRGVEDVGVKGELAKILNTFEPK